MELYLEISHFVVLMLSNPAFYLVLCRVSESWHGSFARLLWFVDFERYLVFAAMSKVFVHQSI